MPEEIQLRTESAVDALAQAATADFETGLALIQQGLTVFRYVDDHIGWISGATGRLKPKCREIELAAEGLREELEAILRKVTGEGPEIVQTVNEERAAAAVAAKKAS